MLIRGRGCLADPPLDFRPSSSLVGAAHYNAPIASEGVRPWCPPVSDQGQEESCVAYAICNALFARQWIEGREPVMPSRRALWYFARNIRGEASSNTGTAPTDAFSAMAQVGYPPEHAWSLERPFDQRPDQEAMLLGADQETVECGRLSDDGGDARCDDLRAALVAQHPVTIAVNIDRAYQTNATGYWTRDGVDAGWHCVMASHYGPDGVWTLGSYGPWHGASGYVLVPWADIADPGRVRDCWAIRFAPTPAAEEAA